MGRIDPALAVFVSFTAKRKSPSSKYGPSKPSLLSATAYSSSPNHCTATAAGSSVPSSTEITSQSNGPTEPDASTVTEGPVVKVGVGDATDPGNPNPALESAETCLQVPSTLVVKEYVGLVSACRRVK